MKSFVMGEHAGRKILVVDGEVFDWGLDDDEIKKLHIVCKKDPGAKDSFIGNIKGHFITSLSDFLGKDITFKDINEALENGCIM